MQSVPFLSAADPKYRWCTEDAMVVSRDSGLSFSDVLLAKKDSHVN